MLIIAKACRVSGTPEESLDMEAADCQVDCERRQPAQDQFTVNDERLQCSVEALRSRSRCQPSILMQTESLMDYLWTPWRYAYITGIDESAARRGRPGVPEPLASWQGDHGCVFCNLMACIDYAIANGMSAEAAEAAGGLVYRGADCFVCLNAYPYTSGHVMVMPYAHLDRLCKLPTEAAHEMMDLAQRTEAALDRLYRPQGYNFGLNLGQAAGAGVAGHLHLHAMPRWLGDTNFMTTISETRILPEELGTTWRRMREAFAE
jgi:ATP adenylyltransferase